jgi:glycine cleavage system P protein (glycine dehydrogenase) subunit 1
MRYIPSSAEGQQKMLQQMGLDSIEDLLKGIPEKIRLKSPLKIPNALSEAGLLTQFKSYERKNTDQVLSFLGAGVNDHYIPTIIDSLISRGEFLTSYTPYQAEISQGTLQAIFEFQTFICQLTGMEVSNASMYDGSTALAEAVLMAARLSQRNRFLMASAVHPEYRAVVETYMRHQNLRLELVEFQEDGMVNSYELGRRMNSDVAAVVVQSPNFLGNIEPLVRLAELAHRQGALLVVVVAEALSLGILTPPGSAGADIVCGETQSLGIPACFGGPHAGFLATRERLVRNLPGRLVGQTVDTEGKRGFVLTLSTREQHIRREKATSNICTNQSLFALMATIYCSLLGKKGIREVAVQNVAKTQYALSKLLKTPGLKVRFEGPRFNEVVIDLGTRYEKSSRKFYSAKIIPGLPLTRYYPELKNCLLLSFTETKSREDIDRLISMLNSL